jgi:hypothetical protein
MNRKNCGYGQCGNGQTMHIPSLNCENPWLPELNTRTGRDFINATGLYPCFYPESTDFWNNGDAKPEGVKELIHSK